MNRLSKYSKHRSDFESGDLLLFKGTAIMSKLIRRFTKSDYSHAGLVAVIGGRVFCMDAVPPRSRIIPVSVLMQTYPGQIDLWKVSKENYDRQQVVDWCWEHLGLPYSQHQIWASAWMITRNFFRRLVGRIPMKIPDVSESNIVCSEYAGRGIGCGLNDDRYKITVPSPQDLADLAFLNLHSEYGK